MQTINNNKILTGPHFVPATRTVTSPPIFLAAVIVFNVRGLSVSLLCSATTKVLLQRCSFNLIKFNE